ncbi:MAG: hypothetical protein ACD_42C00099G0002 [uncultured bacterium]|nr:MAG: hypothetical protein ACD_42C00099G0002 [uncultured bacterium]OGT26885.1 MAG: hypothetical protein A3B71_02145 [Gammaproteobacteria bacterium RIFCSPHIGHO2_02_FULL_42_43]OGT27643.1 MAG: hypothetical protein A2624_00290 [Gammaproteobacteria bacterium RIFCSPHIGHO2_01_FULL_42_8]OGT53379.1 MAG: hypothetical protein A3E54_06630 [Gammaproteobacteria bacterium RIFCSPHIGHO2_12_FULL_41_25]OGT63425.1 MAG: hypothetical protein A3I77_05875 [Gammaproteobacteria bacterium RIFCSPLOWO2_02_FULL_42_14]OGT
MAEPAEKNSGLGLVLMRNAFYRDHYRHAVLAVLLALAIDVILLIGVMDRYLNPPEPQYFAANNQLQFMNWHPLTDPVLSENAVLQWTVNAVSQVFNLDYIHWKQQLQVAQNNFTSDGWRFLLASFKTNLSSLVQLNMVTKVTMTGSPSVQYKGVVGGRYVWKIKLPMMITYYPSSGNVNHQFMKVAVIVERVPVQDNPEQIAINNFLPEKQSE